MDLPMQRVSTEDCTAYASRTPQTGARRGSAITGSSPHVGRGDPSLGPRSPVAVSWRRTEPRIRGGARVCYVFRAACAHGGAMSTRKDAARLRGIRRNPRSRRRRPPRRLPGRAREQNQSGHPDRRSAIGKAVGRPFEPRREQTRRQAADRRQRHASNLNRRDDPTPAEAPQTSGPGSKAHRVLVVHSRAG